MATQILIIDDEPGIRQSLRGILEDEGYQVLDAPDAERGLEVLDKNSPDLVFLDIWLPGLDGLTALGIIKDKYPDLPVVMISGHGNIESAVTALRMGAHDFLEKPLSLDKVLVQARHGLEVSLLRRENQALRQAISLPGKTGLTAHSPKMRDLLAQLDKVAPTDSGVLITGENGTGKEVLARAIHQASKRAKAALVAVNCAAIPENLIESELFGHEKGAFTGADASHTGKFELAHHGTLFLDEIGDMSLKTQAKVLRILQERSFEKVGGSKTIKVDVRIIAATNKNLEQAIGRGEFREDLYYRLRVFPLQMPPLRERQEDIRPLVRELSVQAARRLGLPAPLFTDAAFSALEAWPWPGNVRELGHLVERMTILHSGAVVDLPSLPEEFRGGMSRVLGDTGDTDVLAKLLNHDYKTAKTMFEDYYLRAKLAEYGGNVSRLAQSVGLERSYVHRKLKHNEENGLRALQDRQNGPAKE